MPKMPEAERNQLLAEPRLGTLCMLTEDGAPIGVPVWFEWDGKTVNLTSERGAPKLKRLERDSRASLLIARNEGEPAGWVAIDGRIEIEEEGGMELFDRTAAAYPRNRHLLGLQSLDAGVGCQLLPGAQDNVQANEDCHQHGGIGLLDDDPNDSGGCQKQVHRILQNRQGNTPRRWSRRLGQAVRHF